MNQSTKILKIHIYDSLLPIMNDFKRRDMWDDNSNSDEGDHNKRIRPNEPVSVDALLRDLIQTNDPFLCQVIPPKPKEKDFFGLSETTMAFDMPLFSRSQLNMDEKKTIIELYRGHHPISYIAQRFGRHEGTIRYVIKLYKQTDNLKRRSKLSSNEKLRIKKLVNKKRNITGNQIKTKLGLSASPKTIRRYLHKHGYHYGVSKKVPCWVKKNQ
jgi:transposase